MANNQKLNNALQAKDDEFYTQFSDIEKELQYYIHHFDGKNILCNCDDYRKSNFFRYFAENFAKLKLKSLTAIHYTANGTSEFVSLNEKGGFENMDKYIRQIPENGDFRCPTSLKLLMDADIVVTNPPFSLFREYIDVLFQYDKKFLIIGNSNAATYQNCFEYIKNEKMWLGVNNVRWFARPNGEIVEAARSYWFTNLDSGKTVAPIALHKSFECGEYCEYDNFHAIEVSKTKDIPLGFKGVMGVPVTFLEKYNPKQFRILGMDFDVHKGKLPHLAKKDWVGKIDRAYLKGKRMYSRILIQAK